MCKITATVPVPVLIRVAGINPTCSHDVHQIGELVVMFPGRHQALQDQDLEVLEHIAALSAHNLQKRTKIYKENMSSD